MKHSSRKIKDCKGRRKVRKKSRKNRHLKDNLHITVLSKNSNGSSNWDQLSKIIGKHIAKDTSSTETKIQNHPKFKHTKKMHNDKFKVKNHGKQKEDDSSRTQHSKTSNVTDKNEKNVSNSRELSSEINSSERKHSTTNDDVQINLSFQENKISSKKKKKHKSVDAENVDFISSDRKVPSENLQRKHLKGNNTIESSVGNKNVNLNSKMSVLHLQNKDSEKRKNAVHSKSQNHTSPLKKNSTDNSLKKNSTDKSQNSDKQLLTKVVAMDCEMVGTGLNGEDSMLARVSLVNKWCDCIYDAYVKPMDTITDYRTAVSGIRPSDLVKGKDLFTVQKEVQEILDGRILVGHALKNDLSVLFLSHPQTMIRDTSKYKTFRQLFNGQTPSLKRLTEKILGVEIQTGEHNSIEDAGAAMQIYLTHKKEWEDALRYQKKKRHKRPSLPLQTL